MAKYDPTSKIRSPFRVASWCTNLIRFFLLGCVCVLQKYALVILVEFLCFKYYDDTVWKNYVTYKKEMKFDDFVQLPAFEAQKNVVLQAANILS